MNPNRAAWIRQTARLWFAGIIELLMLMPLLLLFDAFLVPEKIKTLWFAGLPFLLLIGVAARFRLNALWKQWMAAAFIGAIFAFFAAWPEWRAAAVFALGFFASLQGMTVSSRIGNTQLYWIGIAGYFIGSILFSYVSALQASLSVLTWTGILCLAVALFSSNGTHLRYAALADERRQSVPGALRRHNRVFVGILFLAAVILTAGFGNFIGRLLWNAVRFVLGLLFRQPQPERESLEAPAESPPLQPMFPPESHESGLLGKILDLIFYAVSGLILAAIMGYGIYWFYKHGGGLFRKWIDRLLEVLRRRSRNEEGMGYTDQESVVFEWEAVGRKLHESWVGRLVFGRRGERWEDMRTNSDRVRFLYRGWLRSKVDKGYRAQRHLTPLETAKDIERWAQEEGRLQPSSPGGKDFSGALIRLYYKARYSGEDVADEELKKILPN
jgi:hypothetical protein